MKKSIWLIFSLILVVIDQLAKYWTLASLTLNQPMMIFPGLKLTLAFNKGVAFSLLSEAGDWNRWLFVIFAMLMSTILYVWLIKTPITNRLQCAALSLIIGGALGNLYDRLFLGYVVDFIDIYYQHYHWPIFNLADSFICVGAILLIISNYSKASHYNSGCC